MSKVDSRVKERREREERICSDRKGLSKLVGLQLLQSDLEREREREREREILREKRSGPNEFFPLEVIHTILYRLRMRTD